MKVAANPEKSVTHDGHVYFFCSTRCIDKFKAAPQQYLLLPLLVVLCFFLFCNISMYAHPFAQRSVIM